MKSVHLIGDCHSTRIWEHWNPETCPVDFKVWGVAGMTAYAFDPVKFEEEKYESSGIESQSDYLDMPREHWVRPFSEFKNPDLVLVWLGYVDIRQWLPKHNNTEEVVIKYLDRIREYYKDSVIQIIEPLPQFTEMLLKYEGISPSYTYEERQNINKIFIDTLNKYVIQHRMPYPITQDDIKKAVGLKEFTPEDCATWAPHPQDSLKREYWAKIYNLFMEKSSKSFFRIISPAGSGNTFAINLLREYVKDSEHVNSYNDYDFFDNKMHNVALLRNPYDSIASSVELSLESIDKNQIKYNLKNALETRIEKSIKDYEWFLNTLNKEKNSYIMIYSFDSLTKDPEEFLIKFSNRFNLNLKKFNKELLSKTILQKMKNLEIESVRTPRDISKMRSIINKAVLDSEPMKDLFAKYQKQLEKENINGNARASI
jgi:hypothetical protein